MPHTQETTARDLVGKLITFMETGRPGWQPRSRGPDPIPIARSGGSLTADAGAAYLDGLHPGVGDADIRRRPDDDRDRGHGLLAGAAGKLIGVKEEQVDGLFVPYRD